MYVTCVTLHDIDNTVKKTSALTRREPRMSFAPRPHKSTGKKDNVEFTGVFAVFWLFISF